MCHWFFPHTVTVVSLQHENAAVVFMEHVYKGWRVTHGIKSCVIQNARPASACATWDAVWGLQDAWCPHSQGLWCSSARGRSNPQCCLTLPGRSSSNPLCPRVSFHHWHILVWLTDLLAQSLPIASLFLSFPIFLCILECSSLDGCIVCIGELGIVCMASTSAESHIMISAVLQSPYLGFYNTCSQWWCHCLEERGFFNVAPRLFSHFKSPLIWFVKDQ